MAERIDNDFTTYKLNEREELEGQSLNHYQRMVLQNMLANFAAEKLNWKFDPNNINSCLQQEAELQGQIRLLRTLIACSDEAQSALQRLNQLDRGVE